MTNHESGNRVIAEFMELPKCDRCQKDCGGYKLSKVDTRIPSEMGYHTSLDWLKPAIDKFLAIPIETFNYDAKSMAEFRMVRASLANMPISKSLQDFYNELLTAINWLNTQKTITHA